MALEESLPPSLYVKIVNAREIYEKRTSFHDDGHGLEMVTATEPARTAGLAVYTA